MYESENEIKYIRNICRNNKTKMIKSQESKIFNTNSLYPLFLKMDVQTLFFMEDF